MKSKSGKKWKRVVKRLIITLILIALLAGGGVYAYAQLKSEYTITYDQYTASTGSISNSLSFSGSFQTVNSQNVTAAQACKLRTLYVAAGDTVKSGDKLARTSTGETLTADFDGRVNTVSKSVDDELTAGDTIMQIIDFTHMKVSFRVDEYDIASVKVGTACTITATATEKTFDSTISSIDYVSASSGSVAYYTATAYVDVEDGIYPGMQSTVTIPEEEADNVVMLKEDALSFDSANQAYVYKKNSSGEMEKTNVEVGVSNGNYCEIKSGVSDGETVYVEAQADTTTQSGLSGLLSGLFNRGGPNVNGNSGGQMPGGGGQMPDMAGGPGGNSSSGSSSSGSSGNSSSSGSSSNFGGMPSGGGAPAGMGGGN